MRRDVFQAIADPTRRDIINLIAKKALTPNAIADSFDVSRQAISKHIQILTECGLIVINQQGRERYCYVQAQKLDEVSDWLDKFRKIWENRFDRLDKILVKMKQKKPTSMAQKNKLQIVAEKGKQECLIIREFDAPREMVFRAFSDPELFVQFWGPDKVSTKLDYYDFRTGGSYRYLNYDEKGKELCAFSGVIHEVTAPERVIQTSEFDTLPERGHVILETLLFESLPGERTKLTFHEVCRSVADRDAMIESGMESGLEQGFIRLDKLLAKGI